MKKITESQILNMLKDAAFRRFGKEQAKSLSPALRETARAVAATRNQELPLAAEPVFFAKSSRDQAH